jgi:phosphoglycolate phosphatase-like HAD superfamily hydrolase
LSTLLLFDIDGTLLLTGGAGVRAMTRAFEAVFGVAKAFDGIPVSGRTDTFLVSRALVRAGIADVAAAHTAFRAAYVDRLREEIRNPGQGRKGLMPGIASLLEHVTSTNGLFSALLTGNYAAAAEIKLSHFGVASYFSWGAFGEDSTDRDELARLTMKRAIERGVPRRARENAVVIGDTPHDIACARAIGARAIAVATGSYSLDHLSESGADTVLSDLSDTAAVLRLL